VAALLLKKASHSPLMSSIIIQKEVRLLIALALQMSGQLREILGYLLSPGLFSGLEKTLPTEEFHS